MNLFVFAVLVASTSASTGCASPGFRPGFEMKLDKCINYIDTCFQLKKPDARKCEELVQGSFVQMVCKEALRRKIIKSCARKFCCNGSCKKFVKKASESTISKARTLKPLHRRRQSQAEKDYVVSKAFCVYLDDNLASHTDPPKASTGYTKKRPGTLLMRNAQEGDSNGTADNSLDDVANLLEPNTENCREPADLDPKLWDCNCYKSMQKKCDKLSGVKEKHCFQALLCNADDEIVCKSWKNKKRNCPKDDEFALLRKKLAAQLIERSSRTSKVGTQESADLPRGSWESASLLQATHRDKFSTQFKTGGSDSDDLDHSLTDKCL